MPPFTSPLLQYFRWWFCGLLVTSSVLTSSVLASELMFNAPIGIGKVCTFTLEGIPQTMELSLPVNYREEEKWPILYLYPEEGQTPSTQQFQRYTGLRDWLIVGLAYQPLPQDEPGLTQLRKIAELESKIFAAVHKELSTRVMIDPRHVYLGGTGRGGWMASLVSEDVRGLTGTCILLSGRALHHHPELNPGRVAGRTAYLGVGETDPQNMATRMAAGFYKMKAVSVTLEEFPGLGHALPREIPPVLDAWLKSRLYLKHADDASREALKTWYTTSTKAAMAQESVLEKYRALETILADPRLPLCGDKATDQVERAMGGLRNLPEVRTYWQAERDYLRLTRQELSADTVADLKAVQSGWSTLMEELPETPAGQRAPLEIARLQNRIDTLQLNPAR